MSTENTTHEEIVKAARLEFALLWPAWYAKALQLGLPTKKKEVAYDLAWTAYLAGRTQR